MATMSEFHTPSMSAQLPTGIILAFAFGGCVSSVPTHLVLPQFQ
jgi:hypothetical protein